MEVICFGGAETIECSSQYPFARCINYYSINDPLLFIVPNASKALRSGFMGMGNISSGGRTKTGGGASGIMSTGSSLAELVDPDVEPEFVFLTPRAGDPIQDHGLFGPTYIDALRWEGKRYITLYLPPWHPMVQFALEKSSSVTDTLVILIKIFLKKTIVPIILFTMMVNLWIKENIIIPLVALFMKIWEKIKDLIRIMKGEDVYEAVVIPSSSSSKEEVQDAAMTS